MKIIKRNIVIILLIILTQTVFSQDCKKCDFDKLNELSENMNNLNFEIVKDFVCAFDSICTTNIEFSEWSNELLFELIEKDINLLNKVLHDLGFNYVKLIGKELETPIIDFDLNYIYILIKNSKGPKDIIEVEKKAIKIAAEKEGIKLE